MSLRASTRRSYAAHARGYLSPQLGAIPLAQLAPADAQAMFTAIIAKHAAMGQPIGPATLRRIHATIRAERRRPHRADHIQPRPVGGATGGEATGRGARTRHRRQRRPVLMQTSKHRANMVEG
jgi:hypothetical protein